MVCPSISPCGISNATLELQQEADKDSAKYIRHSLRVSASNPSSPSARAPSPKSTLLPGKIAASYSEIHRLSSEKCVLAQTLVDLVTRTRARLDSDLTKVRMLQGEVSEYPGTLSGAASGMTTPADAHAVAGRNPALQVSESLRNALTAPTLQVVGASAAVTPSSTASGGPATKSALFYPVNENVLDIITVFYSF
jgi:chromatin modification-related protein YNG2